MAVHSLRRRLCALVVGTVATFGVMGCGAGTVPSGSVATQVANLLKQQGLAAESVTCEGDLVAEVGKTVRCSATVGGAKLAGTANVVSVEGKTATIDFNLEGLPGAEQPSTPPTT